ncbi:MAG: Rieske 2Fe-2S domain-containing protein [Gemmatimonadetes bacterium]|nr:Rieske 2Fe-2S domain-containing protein [Gemmatimonadota bacterium]
MDTTNALNGAVPSDESLPRREFLSAATLTAVATVLAACSGGGGADKVTAPTGTPNPTPQPGTSGTTLTVTVANFPALANVGGIAAVGNLGTLPVAVVRSSASEFVALSRVCTHARCDVNIQGGAFVCPCHGSRFNNSGGVTMGPASSALQRFNVAVSGGGATLTIS